MSTEPEVKEKDIMIKPTLVEESQEGWMWLSNSPKWHYFMDGQSLCGKWMTFSKKFEQGNDSSIDNCKACQKALAKRKVAR